MYSSKATYNNSLIVMEKPFHIRNGIINNAAQKNAIFPKFLCQKIGASKGNIAIDNKSPQNGIMLNKGNCSPIAVLEANTGVVNKIILTSRYLYIKLF